MLSVRCQRTPLHWRNEGGELRDGEIGLAVPEEVLRDASLLLLAILPEADIVVCSEELMGYRVRIGNMLGVPVRPRAKEWAHKARLGPPAQGKPAPLVRLARARVGSMGGETPTNVCAEDMERFWCERSRFDRSRSRWWGWVARNLVTGRYHRWSRGMRSALFDLVR